MRANKSAITIFAITALSAIRSPPRRLSPPPPCGVIGHADPRKCRNSTPRLAGQH